MINFNLINSYIGEPWVYAVNDCWAVFRKASKEIFGVEITEIAIPKESDYKKNMNLFEMHSSGKDWRQIDEPEGGAAVMFYDKRGRPVHIGIYCEGGNVLHCHGSKRLKGATTYENLKDLKKRYKKIEFFKYANN